MTAWPYQTPADRLLDYGFVVGSSRGTVVSPNASANTKGSWVEICASTPADIYGLQVYMGPCSWQSYLIDIGIGGSGSEIVVIPNLVQRGYGSTGDFFVTQTPFIPIALPKGTRIAARCQNGGGGSTPTSIAVRLLPKANFNGTESNGQVYVYGVNTATSEMTNKYNTNPSANTKGSYIQLTASTDKPFRWLMVGAIFYNVSSGFVDLSIGGSGSEQVILPNLAVANGISGAGNQDRYFGTVFPVHIPSGVRLSYRYSSSAFGGSAETGVAVWGIP